MAMIHKTEGPGVLKSDLPKPIFGGRLAERSMNDNVKNYTVHREQER
jgi:hypothetical protein